MRGEGKEKKNIDASPPFGLVKCGRQTLTQVEVIDADVALPVFLQLVVR